MAAPSQNDITAPFDPTAYTTLSGVQLLQLVSGLLPYLDKGFVVTTTDASGIPQPPDARSTGTPKWQTYIWRRIGADGNIYLYVWNPALGVDSVYYQWQPINLTGISINSVTNAMLVGSITSDKIYSLLFSKLSSIPTATGDIVGVYPALAINSQSVTGGGVGGKIVENTITKTEFAIGAIDPTDASFKPSGTALQVLRTNSAKTAAEWFTLVPTIASGSSKNSGSITSGQLYSVAHGLSGIPSFVRAVLVCNTSELGFTTNDEVDILSFNVDVSPYHVGSLGANATNIFFQASLFSALGVTQKASVAGTSSIASAAHWNIKLYWSL
jgi:hypothetical protein